MRAALISAAITSVTLTVSGVTLPQKSVIVCYDSNTPESIIRQVKNAIIAGGGVITHDFTLIECFSAEATTDAVDLVIALGAQYNLTVEEDHIVHAISEPVV